MTLNALSRPRSRPHSLSNRGDTVLDRFNDKQEGRFLHPTKGWRRLNAQRGKAQAVMAEIFEGRPMSTRRMAAILA